MNIKRDSMAKIRVMSIQSETCDTENIQKSKYVTDAERQREKMAALGQLAGGIAHDFNNQLMSIIGNATMIQKTDNVDKMREYAERIIHISQSAANLTKKILLFSKKESINNEIVNLKNILNNTVNMVDSILDKRIDVIYEYSALEKLILGNETQIENLVFNLIINARDAIDSAGAIKIKVTDEHFGKEATLSHGEVIKAGKYIKISVEDNGIGMSEETLDRMFEPYFTTKNKLNGTGLGLSVVFGMVKSHSGFMNVKSSIGKGTNMEVYFPLSKVKSIQEKYKLNTVSDEITVNTIILVDDDQDVLDIEAELFEDLGYEVAKFSNPLEALNYYEVSHDEICFVVTDMIMPEMGGKELYHQLKQINPYVKTVFISGYSGQEDYEELIREGATFIEKPFAFEELSCQIAKLYC